MTGGALALPVIAPRPHHQGGRLGLRLAWARGPHREPLGARRGGELGIVGHERPALIRLVGDQGEGCSQMQRVKLSRAESRISDDRRARRLRAQSCWCLACRTLADDDERAEVTS